MIKGRHTGDVTWISSVAMNMELINADVTAVESNLSSTRSISDVEMRCEQQSDHDIQRLITYMESGWYPTEAERLGETPNTKVLMRDWNYLKLGEDKFLRRQKGDKCQFVLPRQHHQLFFKSP